MLNQQENQRQRKGAMVLEKPRFKCDMPDRDVKLLNFQLDVANILETRACEINNKERNLGIKNWLGWEGLLLIETFVQKEKEKFTITKGTLLSAKQ